jgi:diaminopropionate ammonia-lyase
MTSTFRNFAHTARLIWPDYRPTRLIELPRLAKECGVARVLLKLENERPLGNFKSLGGMYAGLWALVRASGLSDIAALLADPPLGLPTLICASDGNHGLAVAAAARRVGGQAIIYLHDHVPRARAERIAALGARIVRVRGTFDDAVAAAAADRDGLLIADTTDRLDDPIVARVMEGYGLIASEIGDQLAADGREYPTHMFVQAGVGGFAAAMANGLCAQLRTPGQLVVVEPEAAPSVAYALRAGAPERVSGALETSAEMLSCGVASSPAVAALLHHKAVSVLVSEALLEDVPAVLARAGGPATTPSGAAGLAGLLHASTDRTLRKRIAIDGDSCVLLTITEGL